MEEAGHENKEFCLPISNDTAFIGNKSGLGCPPAREIISGPAAAWIAVNTLIGDGFRASATSEKNFE